MVPAPRSAELERDQKEDGPITINAGDRLSGFCYPPVRSGSTDGHGFGQRSHHNSGEGEKEKNLQKERTSKRHIDRGAVKDRIHPLSLLG